MPAENDSDTVVYEVVLHGGGTDIATLIVEYFDNDLYSTETVPENIWTFGPFPVHPAWHGSVILMPPAEVIGMATGTMVLRVDADDDGVTDFDIRPNVPTPDRVFASTTTALLNTLCIDPQDREMLQGIISNIANTAEQGVHRTILFPRDYPWVQNAAEQNNLVASESIYTMFTDKDKAATLFSFIKSVWKGAE